ncbi:hypothetical protein EUX98_g2423 [Antrodiella citrinella]|uniref:NAD-dependent epimerase/dehydratase domain-containing protein n=1 Tax=Antrodiella citrinella TaxID=2447956 RepID=A0A4S4MZ26_9APHY|nr:hypothetical protein EUX98_g2423 [Antrodiella citrinella]
MSKGLVLVTGVSGYLGSHVVDILVKEGYRVRGTVRSAKVAANKEAFAVYDDAVEIYGMDDLIGGSYPDAFKGVSGIIHLAAPLAGRASAQEAIDVAVDGSLNIFKQAERAGITKFSYISSIVSQSTAFLSGDYTTLKDDQWVSISKEDVINNKDASPVIIYVAEKVLSERAVWEFVEKHPHIEMTTVNPPFFHGPFAPGYKSPYESSVISTASMSTMVFLYYLLCPKNGAPTPYFVDIRDVARALVLALDSPPTSKVGQKRILISSEWVQPSDIIALVVKERPALKDRINEEFKTAPGGITPIVDNKRLKEVLGMEVTPWQKTVLDGVDAILEMEKEWKKRGLTPTFP